MFKFNPKASFVAAAPDEADDDDNISLASTVTERHDTDDEFEVERILAEQQSEDGMMFYLVEWTNFRLDESTWEPEENIGDDLKALWEEDKAKHARGELEPFDVQKYHDARAKIAEAKAERHRRRNAKRKRLGLPLTEPLPKKDEKHEKDMASSEDEAVEDPSIAINDATPAPRPTSQQRIFKGIPSPAHSSTLQQTLPSAGGPRLQDESRRSSTVSQESRAERPSLTSAKRIQTSQPTSTGYQGTARKPSKSSADNTAPKPRPRPTTITGPAAPIQPKLNPVKKTLKAKKSMTQPTGNIFTGGKTRKPRPKFKEAISDPTKDQRFFDKHRFRRLAEKRSRDTEDAAPDVSKMRLFDISNLNNLNKGSSTSRRSSAGSVQSPGIQTSPRDGFITSELFSPSAAISPGSSLANPDPAPLKKKRKSVRFFDDDDQVLVHEPEPMDIDSPTSGSANSMLQEQPHGAHSSPATRPKLSSLNQGRWAPTAPRRTQSSHKMFVLGQSSFPATFNGLPQESPHHPWLADFLDKETLEFQHTCFAKTLAIKIDTLVSEHLASGTITTKDSEPALERIAANLTAGALGLYYGQTEYNIIVYPTKCADWKSIPLLEEPESPSEAVGLRYFIFASSQDCTLILPPLSPSLTSQPPTKYPGTKPKNLDPAFERATVMKRLFDLDYTKLLPVVLRTHPTHTFFLAVPESRGITMQALYHWLRGCNPNCQIYTSSNPGGWDAFRARVDHMHIPGVVIIHETLAWSMRQFPNLSRYLVTRTDEYWCLSEPIHSLPLYPSIPFPEQTARPGEVRMTRLFPYRTAILLTPSFLVSEPRRAHEGLDWFMSKWAGKFYHRLVTAYNIHDYLRELAEEKDTARKDLWNHREDVQPEISANLRGLSDEECRLRFQSAEIAADLDMIRSVKAGLDAQDEDNSPLIYADPSIDPNDEQSLVNWFGWWATLRADQFRKFHVIGSSSTIKMRGSRRGERFVRIPKYSEDTLNDPDAVMEDFQKRDNQVEEPEAEPGADNRAPSPRLLDTARAEGPNAKRTGTLQSDILPSGNIMLSMMEYLDGIMGMSSRNFAWNLYRYPVSWADMDMADKFGDFNLNFRRFTDWMKFTFPFGTRNNKGTPGRFNTYVGFFYTIPGDWDPDAPWNNAAERHPWIAIYRPVNPHIKPYGRCEVIIWDTTARIKFTPNQVPTINDLTFMQRQLIEHVREFGEQINRGTWLDQVWLGGFNWPSHCDSPYPVDVTLRFLRAMLSDIKEYLPAPEHVMESRGFRKVALDASAASSSVPDPNDRPRSPARTVNSSPGSSLFVDQHPRHRHDADNRPSPSPDPEDDDDHNQESTRIIFHPPRATKRSSPGIFRSRCRNRLYEEARLARARAAGGGPDGAPTHMVYTFVPTMDWYADQKAEGRDYAHVNVDSWEVVFGQLKIGEGEKAREGERERERREERRGEMDGRRRESIGSG